MEATAMLEKDHKNAKQAMEEILKSTGAKKKQMFESLKGELELHDSIEEDIFYPALKSHPKVADFPAMDKSAHQWVEGALGQLSKLPIEDSSWDANFKAIQEKLLKHVADEEGTIFVRVREVLSADELNQLGERMLNEKKILLKTA
jgi:hemerythrin superfamily protein